MLQYNIFVGIILSMSNIIFCYLKAENWSVGLLLYTLIPLIFFFLIGIIGSCILKNITQFWVLIREKIPIISLLLFILILMEIILYIIV